MRCRPRFRRTYGSVRAAKERADAREELRQARVLRQVVVRAHAQPGHEVEIAFARSEENDRQRGGQRAQLAAQRKPAFGLIGKPDVEFQVPNPVEIPASGTIDYKYVIVPTGFTQDRYVELSEARPTDRMGIAQVLVEADAPLLHRRDRGRRELLHRQPPLRHDERLDAAVAADAVADRVKRRASSGAWVALRAARRGTARSFAELLRQR